MSVESISSGYNYNCGIFLTLNNLSKVKCWGRKDKGQTSVPQFDQVKISKDRNLVD